MFKYIDLKGKRFGKLTVIARAEDYITPKGKHTTQWLCLCDCGKQTKVVTTRLLRGITKSCGCLRKIANTTHQGRYSKLYGVWCSMKRRCLCQTDKEYHRYGARGITICPEWEKDFLSFKKWAEETGYNENAKRGECTLDRIDVNGNYCPENCRWITNKEQQRNKRTNIILKYNNETHCLAEWAEILQIKPSTIFYRFRVYKNELENNIEKLFATTDLRRRA